MYAHHLARFVNYASLALVCVWNRHLESCCIELSSLELSFSMEFN